jgi:hypothetical protein
MASGSPNHLLAKILLAPMLGRRRGETGRP